jgi:hypothetical protein
MARHAEQDISWPDPQRTATLRDTWAKIEKSQGEDRPGRHRAGTAPQCRVWPQPG